MPIQLRAQCTSRTPKGGLGRMRYNAQISDRSKVRTQMLLQEEAILVDHEAAAQRAAEAAEAFANGSRAVTFLPTMHGGAMLDIPEDKIPLVPSVRRRSGVCFEDAESSPTKDVA